MRTTCEARVRPSTLLPVSFLDAGRSPLISTLPTEPSKPRLPSPSWTEKPGIRLTMSSAVFGRWSAKNSGVKVRTPRPLSVTAAAGAGAAAGGESARAAVPPARASTQAEDVTSRTDRMNFPPWNYPRSGPGRPPHRVTSLKCGLNFGQNLSEL